jgi:hypothetical protein
MQSGGESSTSDGSGASRRQFLKNGATTLGALALPQFLHRPLKAAIQPLASPTSALLTAAVRQNKSVLFVYLAGGPSQLDMYDMKPGAPAEIRGEFRPINTNVSGMHVCEHLPLHAKIADKFAIVNGVEMIDTHGPTVITTGYPADCRRPSIVDILRDSGAVQFQTLSMPHDNWDTHGRVLGRQLSIFEELREKLPVYDQAIYNLISDIYHQGLDKDRLLVVCGEFGRTPWINQHGGRNHWAPSGSVLFAGGGLKMGRVIGDTGPIGERDRAHTQIYTAQNVLATIYRHLGIDPATNIRMADGCTTPLLDDTRPIAELI